MESYGEGFFTSGLCIWDVSHQYVTMSHRVSLYDPREAMDEQLTSPFQCIKRVHQLVCSSAQVKFYASTVLKHGCAFELHDVLPLVTLGRFGVKRPNCRLLGGSQQLVFCIAPWQLRNSPYFLSVPIWRLPRKLTLYQHELPTFTMQMHDRFLCFVSILSVEIVI